ncbi:hypothetical protein ACHAXR_011998 [Thalassiosira sp. AJA248-18]
MSGQYSYPAAPTNPTQHQQRTGPIIVGGAATTTTTRTTATAAATSNATTTTINKDYPVEGRYANASLSILGSYNNEEKNCKKRRADCMEVLDRLVHPLFLCANNNNNATGSIEEDDDARIDNEDEKHHSKKRSKNGEGSVDHNNNIVSGGDNDQSNSSGKIEHHKRLQEELERYKQQNELLMKRRSNVFKSMVSLHELYETGLDGIARMNDLRFVPDNVMPDSIPR